MYHSAALLYCGNCMQGGLPLASCASPPPAYLPASTRYNTETVSGDVLARMKQQMVDSNSSSSHSFLLDDDSTLPFAAAEVLGAMDDKVRDGTRSAGRQVGQASCDTFKGQGGSAQDQADSDAITFTYLACCCRTSTSAFQYQTRSRRATPLAALHSWRRSCASRRQGHERLAQLVAS